MIITHLCPESLAGLEAGLMFKYKVEWAGHDNIDYYPPGSPVQFTGDGWGLWMGLQEFAKDDNYKFTPITRAKYLGRDYVFFSVCDYESSEYSSSDEESE